MAVVVLPSSASDGTDFVRASAPSPRKEPRADSLLPLNSPTCVVVDVPPALARVCTAATATSSRSPTGGRAFPDIFSCGGRARGRSREDLPCLISFASFRMLCQSAEGVVARPRSGSGCCRIEHLSFIDRVHEVDGRRVVIKFRILEAKVETLTH